MFIKLIFLVVLGICVLLPPIGYLITKMVVADYPKEFSKVENSLALSALTNINSIFDNPITKLVIIKYQIVSLEFKDPSGKNVLPEGLFGEFPIKDGLLTSPLDDNKRYALGERKQRFVPEGFPAGHLLSNYKVIIKLYTLFAIPAKTVAIWMEGPNFLKSEGLERKYR